MQFIGMNFWWAYDIIKWRGQHLLQELSKLIVFYLCEANVIWIFRIALFNLGKVLDAQESFQEALKFKGTLYYIFSIHETTHYY